MKFKEFVNWCNIRACDGCWSEQTAITCINIINRVRKEVFWKRERYWKDNYEKFVNELTKKGETEC